MILKILIFAVVGYLLVRLFKNDLLRKQKADEKQEQEEMDAKIAQGEMVKDPQCGTYVSKDSEITVRDGATVYHFCSYDCRDKFLKALQEGGREIPPAGK